MTEERLSRISGEVGVAQGPFALCLTFRDILGPDLPKVPAKSQGRGANCGGEGRCARLKVAWRPV